MATLADIATLTRCCDAPHSVQVAADRDSAWHQIRCEACGVQPARTYNTLASTREQKP